MKLVTKLMTQNDCYLAGRKITPKGIMVHSTATPGVMAATWYDRWNKPDLLKCVHAFLDDKEVYQYLPWDMRGWHAGGSANNSYIGFEICEPKNLMDTDYFDAAWNNAIELSVFLCKQYNLTEKNIIDHQEGNKLGIASNHADTSHWFPKLGRNMNMFREEVKKRLNGNQSVPKANTATYKMYTDGAERTHVIKCRPEDIEITILGNTVHAANVNGINGTFFDTTKAMTDPSACCCLAVNDGKPIGPNAHVTNYSGHKLGVVAWDGKRLYSEKITDYKEIPGMIWGIGGVQLLPEYNPKDFLPDVHRTANHTVLGYDKEGYVYLIVRTNASMQRLLKTCSNLGLIGAVSLDGGGSSQLHFNGNGIKSTRKINSAVIVKP